MLLAKGKNVKKNNEINIHNVSKTKNNFNHRFLITVNVLGGSGPMRFVVNEDDKVSSVIDSSLKLHARGGRLPVLGSDTKNFILYPANAGSDALDPTAKIGASGGRSFVMCKKASNVQMSKARSQSHVIGGGGARSWKTWLNKSFKILSHSIIREYY